MEHQSWLGAATRPIPVDSDIFWAIAGVLAAILSVIVPIVLYWWSRRLVPPEVSSPSFAIQAGYDVRFVDLLTNEESSGYGFPTTGNPLFRPERVPQAPFFEFQVANRSAFVVSIYELAVIVTEHRKGTVYVGMGEMVGGGTRTFHCEINGAAGRYAAIPVEGTAPVIDVPAGDHAPLRLYVTCRDPGLVRLKIALLYRQLWKKGSVQISLPKQMRPILFFDGPPPPYAISAAPIVNGGSNPPLGEKATGFTHSTPQGANSAGKNQ